MEIFWKLLVLVVLVLINGIFAATEIAYLSVNKYELSKKVKQKDKKALQIAKLLGDMSSFLSAIQIAITLSGFLASAFAAESFATEIAEALNPSWISLDVLTGILVVVITVILSYFTLIFGELVPKKIGLARANQVASLMAPVITGVITFFKPFIWILKVSTDAVTRLLRIRSVPKNEEEEIKGSIVDSGLEELEKQLLLNVFEFNDRQVREVMTPKAEVASLPLDASQTQVLRLIKKEKFTRFPVVDGDRVVGVLNVKELLVGSHRSRTFNLKKYLQPVKKVQAEMIIDDAFLYLGANHEGLAVVEQDGEYVGIVTAEDIIESLVGEVFEEFDAEPASSAHKD